MTTHESLPAPDQVLTMTEANTQILTCNEIQPATARGTLSLHPPVSLLHVYLEKREFNCSVGVLGNYPLCYCLAESEQGNSVLSQPGRLPQASLTPSQPARSARLFTVGSLHKVFFKDAHVVQTARAAATSNTDSSDCNSQPRSSPLMSRGTDLAKSAFNRGIQGTRGFPLLAHYQKRY